ncbi:MAG: hypothetical protein K9K62_08380 [Desulfobacteraceae bacterium]|nr:hypothetical protein [Desulfobacteraceae bacterium]
MGGQKTSSYGGVCIRTYPGQYFDEETELYYNCHRYYNPQIGRYLRKDPIGFTGGVNIFMGHPVDAGIN